MRIAQLEAVVRSGFDFEDGIGVGEPEETIKRAQKTIWAVPQDVPLITRFVPPARAKGFWRKSKAC